VTECFKKGFFEVQDAGSQMIAPLLNPQPGERVVDACAGAGGKSLHLAACMKNKGKIISMDIHEWKLNELKKRAARGGVDIIETKVIETNKTIKRLENSFDKILLDVPCSGMGVIRRNPDTKWKLSMEEIDRMILLQREILRDYSKMGKSKSTMVYATCSILNRENEDQVKWFLTETEEGKSWKLVEEVRLWPHKDGFDGFYAAKMERSIY
jgi:16S rRNA (cytosine967-C5)-methyltransferase